MSEQKEHLTALAIKTAATSASGVDSAQLAMDILQIVEDKLVGQIDAADFRTAENAIYKRLRLEAESKG
jgi:hypothetical protein